MFQSRSGRPEDPWLGPEVRGFTFARLAPVACRPSSLRRSDSCAITSRSCTTSMQEAAQVCRDIGLPMVRAETVNDDPIFLDMTADVVLDVWKRYEAGGPLSLRASYVASGAIRKGRPSERGNFKRTAEASRPA